MLILNFCIKVFFINIYIYFLSISSPYLLFHFSPTYPLPPLSPVLPLSPHLYLFMWTTYYFSKPLFSLFVPTRAYAMLGKISSGNLLERCIVRYLSNDYSLPSTSSTNIDLQLIDGKGYTLVITIKLIILAADDNDDVAFVLIDWPSNFSPSGTVMDRLLFSPADGHKTTSVCV